MKIAIVFVCTIFMSFLSFATETQKLAPMKVINPMFLRLSHSDFEGVIDSQAKLLSDLMREKSFSEGLEDHRKFDHMFIDSILRESYSIETVTKALEWSKDVRMISFAVTRINSVHPEHGIQSVMEGKAKTFSIQAYVGMPHKNILISDLVKNTRSLVVISAFFDQLNDAQKMRLVKQDLSVHMVHLQPADFIRLLDPKLQEILILNQSIDNDFFEEVLHMFDTPETRLTFLKQLQPRFTQQMLQDK